MAQAIGSLVPLVGAGVSMLLQSIGNISPTAAKFTSAVQPAVNFLTQNGSQIANSIFGALAMAALDKAKKQGVLEVALIDPKNKWNVMIDMDGTGIPVPVGYMWKEVALNPIKMPSFVDSNGQAVFNGMVPRNTGYMSKLPMIVTALDLSQSVKTDQPNTGITSLVPPPKFNFYLGDASGDEKVAQDAIHEVFILEQNVEPQNVPSNTVGETANEEDSSKAGIGIIKATNPVKALPHLQPGHNFYVGIDTDQIKTYVGANDPVVTSEVYLNDGTSGNPKLFTGGIQVVGVSVFFPVFSFDDWQPVAKEDFIVPPEVYDNFPLPNQ